MMPCPAQRAPISNKSGIILLACRISTSKIIYTGLHGAWILALGVDIRELGPELPYGIVAWMHPLLYEPKPRPSYLAVHSGIGLVNEISLEKSSSSIVTFDFNRSERLGVGTSPESVTQ